MEFDVKKAIDAQERFCDENNLPLFAPDNGKCDHCRGQIYEKISVEKAGSELITGCPHCYYSFCG